VDGEDAFLFRPDEFKSARLHTYDGADYYELVITTERTTIGLSDAYNGL
jgi:hypothetical protein